MATVVLSAVSSAAGGALGGSVLGIGSAAIGQAAGALAGSILDQQILGTGSAAVETGKAKSLRLQTSTEGAPVAQVFGRMRVAGQVIWSTRFRENSTTRTQGGGKNSPSQRITEYSYTISFAVALCEGPIKRVGRIWADGQLLNRSRYTHRVYLGDETQGPDPKIASTEGLSNTPAYRGLAYLVFEDMLLEEFGNRIPQLNFEIVREPSTRQTGPEAGEPLPELIEAVTLSPGTGEFAFDPEPARYVFPAGGGKYANVNNSTGLPDMVAALDQLEDELPNCSAVSLIVSWFGDDLRCGHCTVEPRVEEAGRVSGPGSWTVAGLTSETANPVSVDADGRVNFGGTPDDSSIVRAIQELKARGQKVTLYPFLLMDIEAGNGLPNPYGGSEQPVFPWRGRITLEDAPGQPGSTDQTVAAATEVAEFFGTATASDFSIVDSQVVYAGPIEWTWRRFVLHLAALGAAAGGVDSICIGTELRGLTTIRSDRTEFPAVDELRALAAEVRSLLPGVKITYAADWSEYFGFHPADGTGDVFFHLDPLWADQNIDAIGIDDYTPLSDWRHTTSHLDAEAGSVYSLPYLKSQVEGGEYYDYFYIDESARNQQNRTPIEDGAHGEHWVFRTKDIRNWWSSLHHNRVDGVRSPTPTAWVPESKPVWLTETGCPSVDLGANTPNVFYDGKSSESALPTASRGARDDEMQRRFLQAKIGYWTEDGINPISSVYGTEMIPPDRIYIWTWDSRPWPDFPVRESIWSDGPSHRLGHWVTGRLTSGSLAEVVTEICLRSGLKLEDFDVSRLRGAVDGYLVDRTQSAREALQPLMQVYGFDAFESAGTLVFASRENPVPFVVEEGTLVAADQSESGPIDREVSRDTERADQIRLSYMQSENDYRLGAAEARMPGGDLQRVAESSHQILLSGSKAQQVCDRWLAESFEARGEAHFSLPPSMLAIEPGDLVDVGTTGQIEAYRIDRISDALGREVEAVRTEPTLYLPTRSAERQVEPETEVLAGPIEAVLLDLPIANSTDIDHQPWIAVSADPWPGAVALFKSASGESFEFVKTLLNSAVIGKSLQALPSAEPNRWQRVEWIVLMPTGSLTSAERFDVLNGANRLAVETSEGWEIVQFETAELIDQDTYRLSNMLRGQRGTRPEEIPASARLVLLDGAVETLPLNASECTLDRYWRIGPAEFDHAHPSFVTVSHRPTCVGLVPLAPAHLRARKSDGDVQVTWIRTSRLGDQSFEAVEVPLAEEIERYRIVVSSSGETLRTVETGESEFLYTAAQQLQDGASGAVRFTVSQLSNTVGWGRERSIEVDV
ncbi:MAG: glycoside hydrolase TIM-barrel-like domain-containing protein [Pseudomonadota bacterium]